MLLEDITDQGREPILIDLKQTYVEENTPHFFTPTEHHGLRMIKAANLYAPNVEQRLGYFTYDHEQYWGREIPSFNVKIKFALTPSQQEELAHTVGGQLGRGHRLSLYHTEPDSLLNHFKQNLSDLQAHSEWMVKTSREVVRELVETPLPAEIV